MTGATMTDAEQHSESLARVGAEPVQPPRPEPSHLTVKQAAELMQIPRSTLYEAIQRKEIPSIKIGRHLRLNRATVLSLGDGVSPPSRSRKKA